MNPNIYRLMKQAGYQAPHLTSRAQELVKLTVQEVLDILVHLRVRYQWLDDNQPVHPETIIKNHFK